MTRIDDMNGTPIVFTGDLVRCLTKGEVPKGPFKPGTYWVREMIRHAASGRQSWVYGADAEPVEVPQGQIRNVVRWGRAQKRARIPASHMPRFASRFTLVVGDDQSVAVHHRNIDRSPS